MSVSIENKIEKAHYVASEHDVELLAAAHLATSEATKRTDGQYLRILVQALKAQFNGVRGKRRATKPELDNHSAFLAETHTKLYQAVLRGVTTEDVADDETLDIEERRARATVRNNRAGFARSSASTLQMFIRAGGDVRGLDVETVTKTALRTWAKANTPDAKPRQEFIMSALTRLEREAVALVAEDPDEGRTVVEECMARLQTILDDLEKTDTPERHTATDIGVKSAVLPGRHTARFRPRAAAA